MDIANRRVLITGASRGLGHALAFAFAAAGAREVFAGARKAEDIAKLKNDAKTHRLRPSSWTLLMQRTYALSRRWA